MQTATLLKRCASGLNTDTIDNSDSNLLEEWNNEIAERVSTLTQKFISTPLTNWEALILQHPAYQHTWYDFISEDISLNEMAAFLLENKHYPVFLSLLEKIKTVQICEDGVAAVEENIADEHQPEPHAELMQRLMQAVHARVNSALVLLEYPTLIDRTLVFYYGYYCEPWHLVGSVFATERMGTRRVICMDKGLRRLGLNDHELAFTIIHSECDDHHASDWLERVVIPSVELNPRILNTIAEGIASCLETSNDYLNYLSNRVKDHRARTTMETA